MPVIKFTDTPYKSGDLETYNEMIENRRKKEGSCMVGIVIEGEIKVTRMDLVKATIEDGELTFHVVHPEMN